jgi:Tol biopolymer transport system component
MVALEIFINGNGDIRIWDTVRETLTPLIFDESNDVAPLWTPDGQKVVFGSDRGEGLFGVFWKKADGTGAVEKLYSSPDGLVVPWSWSGDGNTLVLFELSLTPLDLNIAMLSMEGDKQRKGLLEDKYAETDPKISPDGRWIAYTSNKSSRDEVYVRPFPDVDSGGQWQVSTNGGHSPLWSPDGSELFYRNGNTTMVVPVDTDPTFSPGNPETLFQGEYYAGDSSLIQTEITPWDIRPDGKRFLMIKPAIVTDEESSEEATVATEPRKIIIVQNWFEEVKDKAPAP